MRRRRSRGSKGRQGFELSDHEVDPATHVVELRGELDLFTAPRFRGRLAEVIESGTTRVIVDLSEATYLDSTAIGALAGALNRLRAAGGSLMLVSTDKEVLRVFKVTGLDKMIEVHDSVEGALTAAR